MEQPLSLEKQIKSRIIACIKKTRSELLPQSVVQEANKISSVLNQLKDAKTTNLKAWPEGFSYGPQEKIMLVGNVGERSIKATRPIEIGDSPQVFLENLESFLKNGKLPNVQKEQVRPAQRNYNPTAQSKPTTRWEEDFSTSPFDEVFKDFKPSSSGRSSPLNEALKDFKPEKNNTIDSVLEKMKQSSDFSKENFVERYEKFKRGDSIVSGWHVLKSAQRISFSSNAEKSTIMRLAEQAYVDDQIKNMNDPSKITSAWHVEQGLKSETFYHESIREAALRRLQGK